MKMKYRCL